MLLFSSVCSFFWSPFRVARWRTLLGFCICAVACTSCSVDKHMERKTVELMDKMAAIPNWDELPRREISWDTAMAVMMEGNLDLKRSEQALRATERSVTVSYTHLRAHETRHDLVCRLLLEKKKKQLYIDFL